MPLFAFLVAVLFFFGCSKSTESGTGPLIFSAPRDWKMNYVGQNGVQHYSITPPAVGSGLLMFSKWPPGGSPDQIPLFLENMSDGFAKTMTNPPPTVDARGRISGKGCDGQYISFRITEGGTEILQTMFMMDLNGQIWNGQFTGSTQVWAQSLALLNSLERVR